MKINLRVRIKNPWFWISLVGVILTAMGVSPEMLTSWGAVWEALKELVMNPYLLGCVILAVLGVFIDPTTKGVSDSDQAMTYTKPKAKE
jgi:phi LC3 family holin